MTYHRGDYIGGHSGIAPSTRKVVVAELRKLADQLTPKSGEDGTDYARGVRGAMLVLRARADEIEDAGAWRWDCGSKLSEGHVEDCSCPKPVAEGDDDHQNELAAREVRAAIGILPA